MGSCMVVSSPDSETTIGSALKRGINSASSPAMVAPSRIGSASQDGGARGVGAAFLVKLLDDPISACSHSGVLVEVPGQHAVEHRTGQALRRVAQDFQSDRRPVAHPVEAPLLIPQGSHDIDDVSGVGRGRGVTEDGVGSEAISTLGSGPRFDHLGPLASRLDHRHQ